ncbi:MAG: hypothetical protein OXU77_09310 [Gammaproteobacteria bacterium]|nr:hypothetical protein [Gammaproteobacteria bacterium]
MSYTGSRYPDIGNVDLVMPSMTDFNTLSPLLNPERARACGCAWVQ